MPNRLTNGPSKKKRVHPRFIFIKSSTSHYTMSGRKHAHYNTYSWIKFFVIDGFFQHRFICLSSYLLLKYLPKSKSEYFLFWYKTSIQIYCCFGSADQLLAVIRNNVLVHELRTNRNWMVAGVDRVRVEIFNCLLSYMGVSSTCFVQIDSLSRWFFFPYVVVSVRNTSIVD